MANAKSFVLDANFGFPVGEPPWSDILQSAGVAVESTTDLVHIDQLLGDEQPDIAYVPGADFCKLIIQGNTFYDGLAIATSKYTGEPSQRTLLVVRADDPATSIQDLAGAKYGYINKSCSSSYFPVAILLGKIGKSLDFLDMVRVPGWQHRVDAVVSKDIRATMILEDVWKDTPENAENVKVIGQFDRCPPAVLITGKRLGDKAVSLLRDHLLRYVPDWDRVNGAFRPYSYADVQTFVHYMRALPPEVLSP
jgi:phosphonate transport system substrate-binding protein